MVSKKVYRNDLSLLRVTSNHLQMSLQRQHILLSYLKTLRARARFSKAPKTFRAWGPFLEGPEKFSDPESHNKNLQP